MFKQFKDEHGHVGTLSTFCFGYNLNSKLMSDIAQEGGGEIYFLPEANFVITTFANYIANVRSTAGIGASVTIEPLKGASIVFDDSNEFSEVSWGGHVDVGTLPHGRPHALQCKLKLPSTYVQGEDYLRVTLSYTDAHNLTSKKTSSETFHTRESNLFGTDQCASEIVHYNGRKRHCLHA